MSFTESLEDLVAQNGQGLLSAHPTWERVLLGLVFDVQNGFPFESRYFNVAGHGVPLLRIRDVVRGSSETYYSGKYDPAFLVNRGDIVVGMDGDFNCRVWQGPPALLNQRVCRLSARNGCYSTALLAQVIQGYLDAVNGKTSAITVKHLSSRTIKDIPLPLPPSKEQQRIVEAIDSYLTRLDDAVASLERVQIKLKAYRASVLKAAVEGRLVPTEASLARAQKRAYEPAEVLLARVLRERRRRWEEAELARFIGNGKTPKDDKWKAWYEEPATPDTSRLPVLPEGWCWASVDQVAESTLIGLVRSRREQRDVPPGFPYLKMNAIGLDGSLDMEDLVYVDADQADAARYSLRPNDILFNTRNSVELVGKTALVPSGMGGPLFNNNIMRMRVSVGLAPAFIALQMSSLPFRERLEKIKRATTSVAAIYGKDLFPQALAISPVAEQERITEVVAALLSIQEATDSLVVRQTRRTARMRQSLLKWAFEGKLVDQDPTDEPAEELLARIRAERGGVSPVRKVQRDRPE